MKLISATARRVRLDLILIGALPFVLLAISPERALLSVLVALVFAAGAIFSRRWTSADRLVLVYALVAGAFVLLSLLRVETITPESGAAQQYAVAKAFYFLAVILPISVAAASLASRPGDIRPAALTLVGVGVGVTLLTVALRSPSLLGETRYTVQGNLAALGCLLLFQLWILRNFWLGASLGLLSILAVGMSNSRQSVTAVAIGLVATALYWLLADRLGGRAGSLTRLWLLPLVLVIVGSAILAGMSALAYRQSQGLSVPGFLPDLWKHCDCLPARIAVLFSQQGGRDTLLVKGWRLFLQHPIFGGGLGSYLDTHAPYRYPHNLVLEIAAELGLVGVVVLLGPLLWGWARLLALGIRARSQAVASLMSILLVYTVVANLSGDLPSARGLWIFGILAFKFGMTRLPEAAPPPRLLRVRQDEAAHPGQALHARNPEHDPVNRVQDG